MFFSVNGEMNIKIEGTSFAPGSAIKGKVVLLMTKEAKSKKLVVRLQATNIKRSEEFDIAGIVLSENKAYSAMSEEPFEILIPSPLTYEGEPVNAGEYRWDVVAKLDVQWTNGLICQKGIIIQG